MRACSPLYEGDSIIHYAGALALPKGAPMASKALERSPLAAIGDALRGFFLWLEKGVERARYRELESYLAESGDVFELERRIRNVERNRGGMFDPYS